MSTHEDIILRILGAASEPLHCSEIADRLNRELRLDAVYHPVDVVKRLQGMREKVVKTSDGRWKLKRRTMR